MIIRLWNVLIAELLRDNNDSVNSFERKIINLRVQHNILMHSLQKEMGFIVLV